MFLVDERKTGEQNFVRRDGQPNQALSPYIALAELSYLANQRHRRRALEDQRSFVRAPTPIFLPAAGSHATPRRDAVRQTHQLRSPESAFLFSLGSATLPDSPTWRKPPIIALFLSCPDIFLQPRCGVAGGLRHAYPPLHRS